LARIYQHWL